MFNINTNDSLRFVTRPLRRRVLPRTAAHFFLIIFLASNIAQAVCSGFPSYAEIESSVEEFAQQYPDLCQLDTIGESVEGRSIYRLVITNNPLEQRKIPEVRIIGGIHGDECQSVDEVLRIIDWLLRGYDVDSERRRFVDNIEFHIVPLVNPDGYVATTRENANYLDINRNFGFSWSESNPLSPFSEPESRAIRDFSQQQAFVLGLSYHTQANYVNGPWNYTPFHPRDEDLIDAIGYDYAGDSSYDVVFGWDWYEITGDVNDWSLGTQGTFDWTIELTSSNNPVWDVHEPGLRAFFNWAFRGVQGTVTDKITGESLHAMITVEPEGAPIFSDSVLGDYHRILMDGNYEITAWAPGYQPKTIENIEVSGDVRRVDFALSPNAKYTAGFQVNGSTLPRDISNAYVATVGYDNDTIASDALGMPDGYGYALSAGGGTITIDMGEAVPVRDVRGMDLKIVSATGSSDVARVFVATEQDGPFTEVAYGSGDMFIDLQPLGLTEIRYVRVVDDTTGVAFNVANSGYDLDAVVNLSHAFSASGHRDTKSSADTGIADGASTDIPDAESQTHPVTVKTGAAQFPGCTTAPSESNSSLFGLLFL